MNIQSSLQINTISRAAVDPAVAAGNDLGDEETGPSFWARVRKGLLLAAPVIGLALFFVAWQLTAVVFDIKVYELPRPTKVLNEIVHSKLFYWDNARTTMWEALVGFALAFALAMIVATAMAHSRFIERAVLPLAVLIQVTPIIAYASAIVIWQGFGFRTIVVITTLVCFVPFLINGVTGLRSVDPNLIELARSVNASRREVYFRLRLPSALPNLFAAARIAVGLALIGAVLGEFFGGSTQGLGYVIKVSQNRLPSHIILWASVFVLGFIGAAATFLFTVTERFALHWHSSQRE